ncbi:LexA family protein [Faecalibaculum rodentium]|uniref:LexA family protein n=1 Tax=Faecalibaculum rodentium TaxID=1702221 RepID=UPI00272D4308|nr:XRE family transcriptional regulator [Faecalibaculum rodentium]
MELGDKVKQRRTELGLSQGELAERMGYSSRSSINKIENGRAVSQKIIARLAEALNVSIPYLMSWEEEEDKQKCERGNLLSPERLQIHLNTVPVYDPISCGTGKWVDEQPVDYLGVPDTMVSKACHYFANPAYGDSMEPRILNGDYIVFEQTESIDPGCIGAFSLNGEYFCKRFKKLPDGSMWLFSENPRYDPIPIQRDDDFRVLGKYRMRMTEN